MGINARYTHVEGKGDGREYPVAASQYLGRLGGKFVYLVDGNITVCASDTGSTIGWAVTPKDAAGYNAVKSSGTAAADKWFVIGGLEDVFEIPAHDDMTVAATQIGRGCQPVLGGSTYTTVQSGKMGLAASILTIVDVDTTNSTYFVKIKPAYKQVG